MTTLIVTPHPRESPYISLREMEVGREKSGRRPENRERNTKTRAREAGGETERERERERARASKREEERKETERWVN